MSPARAAANAQLHQRLAELEAQAAGQIEAPQQHLHLHGISAEDLAAILAHGQLPQAPDVNH